jgi:hypothetical protein
VVAIDFTSDRCPAAVFHFPGIPWLHGKPLFGFHTGRGVHIGRESDGISMETAPKTAAGLMAVAN